MSHEFFRRFASSEWRSSHSLALLSHEDVSNLPRRLIARGTGQQIDAQTGTSRTVKSMTVVCLEVGMDDQWGMDGKVVDHGHKILISKIVEYKWEVISASWFQITGAHLKLLPSCKWTWWSLSVKHWVANPRYQNHTCCWSGSIWPPLDEGNTTWTVNVEAPSHFRVGLSSTLTEIKPNAGNSATYLETYWRKYLTKLNNFQTVPVLLYRHASTSPYNGFVSGVGYRIYTNLIAVCSIFPTSMFTIQK